MIVILQRLIYSIKTSLRFYIFLFQSCHRKNWLIGLIGILYLIDEKLVAATCTISILNKRNPIKYQTIPV